MSTFMDGIIVRGMECASKNLPAQLPVFEEQYDELRGAHHGTINVKVNQEIDLKIDFRTLPFPCGHEWWPFEFVRVLFEYPVGGTTTKAWIYQPYGYHWGVLKNKFLVEILASEFVDHVAFGAQCRIHIVNHGWGASESTSAHYLLEKGKHPKVIYF